jgi:hypothetical protein
VAGLGNGNGTFRKPAIDPSNFGAAPIVIADFNHDGKLDAAYLGYSTINVMFGNGDGAIRMNRFVLSHDSVACRRSPKVSSTAFDAQPPDLPPVSLMDMGFAVTCPLARHRRPHIRFLFIGSRLCSTLLSGPAPRRVLFHPCASLTLRLHQTG